MAKKRFKIPAKKSKKLFSRTARKINKRNFSGGSNAPMRGGIRM